MANDLRTPWKWVPTLYMAEGIPYVIVMSVATVMYKRMGWSNDVIAFYTSWLYLPWVIKPVWSPVVDMVGTKRRWAVLMQLLIALSLAAIALTLQWPAWIVWSLPFLWLMAFFSATHDIAADGFYMLALDKGQQAFFVGIRSTFYRIASILGSGLLIMFAGALETRLRPSGAWSVTFVLTAVLFLLFFLFHARVLPRPQADHASGDVRWRHVFSTFLTTFVSFFRRPQIVPALLFMLLYRLPEALFVKICPLFMLDEVKAGGLGMTTGEVGIVQGTIGVIGLTLGGILGGVLVERYGLKRLLWPMVLSLTLPSIVYVWMAYDQPADALTAISACVFVEQFGYGFGFTAYMLYLIIFSRGENATAHYAICTGFMALGMMLPGLVAGYLQEWVGYFNYFIIAMALCIVTFVVAAFIRVDDEAGEAAG